MRRYPLNEAFIAPKTPTKRIRPISINVDLTKLYLFMLRKEGGAPETVTNHEDGMTRILSLLQKEIHGLSISDISRKIGLNRNSVAKYLGVLVTLGKVERHTVGSAKVYLASSRPSLLELFDHIQDSVIIIDSDLTVRGITLACCDRFGLSKEGVVGQAATEVACPFLEGLVTSDVFSRAIRGTEQVSEIRVDPGTGARYRAVYIPVVLFNGQCGIAIIFRGIHRAGKNDH
ncbi:hypothetical protein MBBA_2221 [Methanoculleus bourgensis]|jgi:PAS domain-containing protein|nr:hypothetical protein MBBA_2221 [Methanoculleus bourgensis]